MKGSKTFFVVLLLAGLIAACGGNLPESRLALWNIVHDQCVPHQLESGDPAPCAEVDVSHGVDDGFVVFPDRNGVAQFLLLPTRRITGIESPALRAPAVTDYWSEAWKARRYVVAKLHRTLSWDEIGLAVNPASARSQDQLHIHIDCMKPEVRNALRDRAGEIGARWQLFSVPLAGRFYRARRIPTLESADLFGDLVNGLGIAPSNMGEETLIVTGGGPQPDSGFIILEDHADLAKGDHAHGENLLDPACAIAK